MVHSSSLLFCGVAYSDTNSVSFIALCNLHFSTLNSLKRPVYTDNGGMSKHRLVPYNAYCLTVRIYIRRLFSFPILLYSLYNYGTT